jgi:hypothetical protein
MQPKTQGRITPGQAAVRRVLTAVGLQDLWGRLIQEGVEDLSTLSALSDAHLVELGITRMGDRVKLRQLLLGSDKVPRAVHSAEAGGESTVPEVEPLASSKGQVTSTGTQGRFSFWCGIDRPDYTLPPHETIGPVAGVESCTTDLDNVQRQCCYQCYKQFNCEIKMKFCSQTCAAGENFKRTASSN